MSAGSVRFAVFDRDAEVVPGEVWRIHAEGADPVIDGVRLLIGGDPPVNRIRETQISYDVW